MKVIYEFNTMDENYDRSEHEMYKQSFNMMIALSRIEDELRSWRKWESYPIIDEYSEYWNDLSEEKKKIYLDNKTPDIDKMIDKIYNIIRDAGVRMEEMGY